VEGQRPFFFEIQHIGDPGRKSDVQDVIRGRGSVVGLGNKKIRVQEGGSTVSLEKS
jgi:hypothetical protein